MPKLIASVPTVSIASTPPEERVIPPVDVILVVVVEFNTIGPAESNSISAAFTSTLVEESCPIVIVLDELDVPILIVEVSYAVSVEVPILIEFPSFASNVIFPPASISTFPPSELITTFLSVPVEVLVRVKVPPAAAPPILNVISSFVAVMGSVTSFLFPHLSFVISVSTSRT